MQDRLIGVNGILQPITEMKLLDIDFNNCHLVAEFLIEADEETAGALMRELDAQTKLIKMKEK